MVYLFKKFGYLTVIALNGEEGIAIAKQERPDLIVCDIKLPKLNGYEVVKIVKNDTQLKHIPVIAVTAYAMMGDRDNIHASGFDGYIAKPIDPTQFISQIESLLPVKLHSNIQFNVQSSQKAQQKKRVIGKCHVALIVDDFLANRELTQVLLESIGLQVIAVNNVNDAIAVIQKKIPDLILSDFHLPDINGLDFL